jgi:DNA-binding FadR family transcriptional regulator
MISRILENLDLSPVSVQRLYRTIADRIIQSIRGGRYEPGDRLPTERDLAERLQVSRTTVREALIALEVEGYVEVRVGSGVYVRQRQDAPIAPASVLRRLSEDTDIQASGENPLWGNVGAFELLHVNLIVEPEAAAMAAANATEAQLKAICDANAVMEHSKTPRLHNRLFHIAIGEATGNLAMALTVRHLWDIHDESVMFNKLEQLIVGREAWEKAEHEHDSIVEALCRRDAEAARAAMRAHFMGTRSRLRQDFSLATESTNRAV